MVAIYHAYYNFCRVHQTLRVTPAMEAGITNRVWSVHDLVTFMEVEKGKSRLKSVRPMVTKVHHSK